MSLSKGTSFKLGELFLTQFPIDDEKGSMDAIDCLLAFECKNVGIADAPEPMQPWEGGGEGPNEGGRGRSCAEAADATS